MVVENDLGLAVAVYSLRYSERLESRAEQQLVELVVFPGRTPDAKRKLYAGIAANLARAGVDPQRTLVVLHEPPLANWGIRGGQAATDVDLGFKIDV